MFADALIELVKLSSDCPRSRRRAGDDRLAVKLASGQTFLLNVERA